MTEALFRIPSRTVTYGYVEVSVDLGHSDPEIIAATYVSWVHAFQKEELATIERLKDAPSGALKAPLAAPEKPLDVGVPGAAQQRAEGNLKPRTVDEANDMAKAVIEKELGPVTELPEYQVGDKVTVGGIEFTKHSEVPWEQDLARKSKPWETEDRLPPEAVVTSPAVLDAVW